MECGAEWDVIVDHHKTSIKIDLFLINVVELHFFSLRTMLQENEVHFAQNLRTN